MTTIPIEDLFLITYCLVDDWYLHKGHRIVNRIIGVKPTFGDSEVLTLMLAADFFEFTSERRYLSFIRANYLSLFPDLPDQSQFNRRSRSLSLLLEELRKEWAKALGILWENHFIIDTTPVIAVGYRRDKSHSDFLGSADYGYCAARRMKYFGYKLVMLTTVGGIPCTFELVPANTDERDAADEILGILPYGSNVWSDKGFIGEDWQFKWQKQGVRIWTAKRKNQHDQNPVPFDRLLNSVRERIEGVFDLLKEGGRSVEKTSARTVKGLISRIISKIGSLTFRLFLRKFIGIDILTYTVK